VEEIQSLIGDFDHGNILYGGVGRGLPFFMRAHHGVKHRSLSTLREANEG
jgi:hypothetical protein